MKLCNVGAGNLVQLALAEPRHDHLVQEPLILGPGARLQLGPMLLHEQLLRFLES